MKIKRFLALGLAAVMALSMVGCSTPGEKETTTAAPAETTAAAGGEETTAAEPAATEKVFTFSQVEDIATIDPQKSNAMDDSSLIFHMYDGLYRNYMGDIQPAVATGYTLDDTQTVYTFTLREDAYWSDGVQVTAKDFEYGLKRLMDPATAAPMSWLGVILKNGAQVNAGEMAVDELGVKAIDDFTLEVAIEYPAEYFLGMLSMALFMPARQDLVEKYGEAYASTPENTVFNGPFKCVSWGEGQITIVKNDSYYDADKINLDKVQILTVADGTTAIGMFDAGELDLCEVPTDMVPMYDDNDYTYYSGANDYMALNHNNEYLANKNLRLAMNYAINREEYGLLSHNGVYTVNQRFVLPQVACLGGEYGTEYPLEYFPLQGDDAKAQEYMAAALEELGVAASDIVLKLVYSDSEDAKKEAEVCANMWETKLGIDIQLSAVPGATRNAMLVPNCPDFDIILTGWVPDYSDPDAYLMLWKGDSTYNYLNYHSDEYDKLLTDAATATGKERMDMLFEAEQVLLADGALVPLQLRQEHYVVSENVTGIESYFIGVNYIYMYADVVE